MSRLLELAVQCPSCGRRPPIRIFPLEVALHRKENENTPCQTIACSCGEVYVVTCRAYQEARTPTRSRGTLDRSPRHRVDSEE